MELRSSSHLHFINAVKGGLVVKSLNVFRQRPALKFKKLEEIHETGKTMSDESPGRVKLEFEFEGHQSECYRAKAQSPVNLGKGRARIKRENEMSGSNYNDCENGVKEELDDLNLDNLTLKQIKERCTGKKRKCSSYVGSREETIKSLFVKEEGHSNLQHEEDEIDKEPLIRWKSRISKTVKAKRKCRKLIISPSSQDALPKIPMEQENALTVVKSEEMETNTSQSSGNWLVPIAIQVEDPKPTYPDCRDLVVSVDWLELLASRGVISSEEAETSFGCALPVMYTEESEATEDCVSETMLPMTPNEESEIATDRDIENQKSAVFIHEHQPHILEKKQVEPADAHMMPDLTISSEMSSEEPETSKDCASKTLVLRMSSEQFEAANHCGLEIEKPTFFSHRHNVSAVKEEYKESALAEPTSALMALSDKIMLMDIAEVKSHQLSKMSLSEIKEDISLLAPQPKEECPKTVCLSKDYKSDKCHDSHPFPCVDEIGSSSLVRGPDTIDLDSLQCSTELDNTDDSDPSGCQRKDGVPDLGGFVINTPVINSSSFGDSHYSNSGCCLVSAADDSSAAEENQSLFAACADVPRNASESVDSCTEKPVTPAEVENIYQSKQQNPPERLLSTRKAMSPTSQKRLCKALESYELDDEQYYKYARKLCYGKYTENKTGRPEGTKQMKKAEVTISPRQSARIVKIDQYGFHQKGTVKSRSAPRFSTGCTSVQSCSESAISFSQQQMLDIETVANKLAKELKSMKAIVESTLHSRSYSAPSFKYSVDEVRNAIENATKVEENARKWLSTMSRDCSRFCKIMKLSGSASSANMAQKERRKIVFADEAGGKLCHVKTFENDMATNTESSQRTDNVD